MAAITHHVLMVDDNQADIDLTSETLSRILIGSDVQTVPDGVEAMEYLTRAGKYGGVTTPDLVILDLNLPRKDGRSVLLAVKSDPELRKIPVVIFSTSQSEHDIGTSYALGANSYINKPGNLSDYVATITSLAKYWFATVKLAVQGEQCEQEF